MERLGIGQSTAYLMLASGDLPYVRIRGDRRVTERDLENYIAKNRVAGDAA